MKCILCQGSLLSSFPVKALSYWHCDQCDLIFLDPDLRLSQAGEKARYEKHENNVLDSGYQAFVNPLYKAVLQNQNASQLGLDYGSGKNSAINHLLLEKKFVVNKYDPFFYPEPSVLHQKYDYVIVCEVAEHFYDPAAEFQKLKNLLKLDGHLYVMTSLKSADIDFANWSYRRDSTHVCFYSQRTCDYIKTSLGFSELEISNSNVVVFKN